MNLVVICADAAAAEIDLLIEGLTVVNGTGSPYIRFVIEYGEIAVYEGELTGLRAGRFVRYGAST